MPVVHDLSESNSVDEVIMAIRNLYDGELDAEDHMVDTFLSSHSRSISEYTGHEPASPGAQSTVSVDISDSDYRTRRALDRDSRDIRDMPMPASSLGRSVTTAYVAEPHTEQPASTPEARVQSPSRNLRSGLRSSKSPSFIAARQVFEKAQSQPDYKPKPKFNGHMTTPKSASISAQMRAVSDRVATSSTYTGYISPPSPELGQPTPTKDISPNETNDSSEESQELRSGPRPSINFEIHELSDDDEEYPDPLSLLESRSPHPMVASPLNNNNTNEDNNDADSEQTGDVHSDRSSRSSSRVKRRAGSWKGLGKRRRESASESGYGDGALPVVIDRRATLPTVSVASVSALPAQSDEVHNPIAQRAHSYDTSTTPTSRRVRALAQAWSTPKRIRMSITESSDTESDNIPLDTVSLAAREAELPSSAPAATVSLAENSINQVISTETVVFAEESSSYPTISSSAPQMTDSQGGSVPYVSQTPDMTYLNPSATEDSQGPREMTPEHSEASSRESTVPIPDSTVGEDATVDSAPAENVDVAMDVEESVEAEGASENLSEPTLQSGNESVQPEESLEPAMEEGEAVDVTNDDTAAQPPAVQAASSQTEDIDPVDTEAVSDKPAAQEPTVQEPTVQELTVQEPTVQEPTVQEPAAQVTPLQPKSGLHPMQRAAATTSGLQRASARIVQKSTVKAGAATQPQPSRQRRPTVSRRISMCQRLLQLSSLSKGTGNTDIHMDPALAPPARLLGSEFHSSSAFSIEAISAPSTPTRRAAFSGAMRVLGEGAPVVVDSDRLRYMCKVKGLMEGTELSATEALRVLYFFTGDWVSARRYIVHGQSALTEDCMWTANEDKVLLQGFNVDKMADLRERKGNVEVYRRLQFLNTFHGLRAQ
ncbi:hypothetical protein LPJ77_000090 [Coemansia sp. RSA 2523]|nr:hypothetical protein LPJ77_000090 [Coemansia sp. RSA 2523]KAJ2447083.1 hypothetical protein IWW46_000521 [Coemansia sp. RSA 2440]